MEQQQAYPGLEIDIDPRQQRFEWRLQRIVWLLLTALLIAIMLGVLGQGVLSKTAAMSADGSLRIEYDRFMRHHSPDTLRVTMQAPGETARLSLASDYLQRLDIEKVTPQPAQVISEPGAMSFVFHARPGTRMEAVLHISPDKVGPLEGWVAVDGKPPLSFRQFVYP